MNKANRNLWVDYLRSALTVLVIAHHSSLAYTTFAKFDKIAYIRSTHPVVDINRWIGLDLFENFNDVFFMSLMFFIGGLFLIKSINRKGIYSFLNDRFLRLFVPFLLLGTFFMLIAYFPSYYIAHNHADIIAYIKDFFVVENWPVGPPWFIWVLFLFNLIFALFYSLFQMISNKVKNFLFYLNSKPFTFFILLYLVTWILYVPIAYNVGAGTWVGIGPFDFQLSRILLYFGYFAVGIIIGNTDFNNEIFSTESPIVKKWWKWAFLSLSVYVLLTIISKLLTREVSNNNITEFKAWMIYYFIYVASCVTSCIAFIAIYRKWVNKGNRWLNSLSENAYLIYLIHYIFVIWCQFLLLPFTIPAFAKFLLTFVISLTLSWAISNLFRKIKIINTYL